MKQKILIYLCMNAIFSKTIQDTETQIITIHGLEGTANSNMVSNCQYNIWDMFLLTIEMLVFILQLKKCPLKTL